VTLYQAILTLYLPVACYKVIQKHLKQYKKLQVTNQPCYNHNNHLLLNTTPVPKEQNDKTQQKYKSLLFSMTYFMLSAKRTHLSEDQLNVHMCMCKRLVNL